MPGPRAGASAPRAFTAPEVWLVALPACAGALSEIERHAQLLPSRFAAEGERRLAHIALRLLLQRTGGSVAGIAFSSGFGGKPTLEGTGSFSLSHCAGYALVGLGGAYAIGVDVEQRQRQVKMSMERAERIRAAADVLATSGRRPAPLSQSEADGNSNTLQAWVRLEAIAKVDGIGVGRVLTALGVLGRPGSGKVPSVPNWLSEYSVFDLDLGDQLVGAAAGRFADAPPTVFELPENVAEISAICTAREPVRRIGD